MADTVKGQRQVIEIWEPTFRMKPRDDEKFIPQEVEKVIKAVMDEKLAKAKYDDNKCKAMAMDLCSEIKAKVQELNIPRYKLVLQSVIGEVKGQGAYIASRCLWDTETDNYASYSCKNSSLFCVLMVFGLYLE
mmetsp:Transcript_14878/g.20991  ORF Transcript_14878/g.20991 Transcript_14878/m.20991 type:complete len:133 (+) Transcript_14878:34-432(+)|eukprot:CAMPEP_0175099618 /NCGR_PEP_ID=MMETSP0086_2-20121207/6565_1 /TAXON_ID=136419 /ORGANISM="Unknown Unknown, Strain D1" /LENGTH=132 /DNA_ID=CAMNT_0016373505 /DNA_START=34 /DNA_END=432 /DNA_ORIENTATION=+